MKYLLIGVDDRHFDKLAGHLLWQMSDHLGNVHRNEVQIQGTRERIVAFLQGESEPEPKE